jgi:MscS family membrane protein
MQLPDWISLPYLYIAGGWGLGVLFYVLFPLVVGRITQRTKSELDDILTERLRVPGAWSFLGVGFWYALSITEPPEPYPWVLRGLLASTTVFLWTMAISGTSRALLSWLVVNREQYQSVNARTLPVFDIVAKTVVWGGSLYFLFLAWDVDLTGWLASAGVIGVAVGFASKDTLSNLIAGVFILTDAPYKLGDYLVLENGERGEVIEIGIRTTRLRTRDDVEIIVPNAVMANSRVVNQSGGPGPSFRVRVKVTVAYGTDLDVVRAMLEHILFTEEHVLKEPAPRVRFRSLGEYGLELEMLGWIRDPSLRGLATDVLLTSVYKQFAAQGIEIPYPRYDVVMRPPKEVD